MADDNARAEQSFTYSGDPTSSEIDAVRVLLGDTNFDGAGWMLADEEILFAIGIEGTDPFFAAAFCAESLIGPRFTGPTRNLAEKRVGDLLVRSGGSGKSAVEDWAMVARRLRLRIAMTVSPFAGGQDVADKLTDERDPTLPQPAFVRDQFDTPFTSDTGTN